MKAIAGEGLQGSGPRPEVVVDTFRYGFLRRVSNCVAPLEAQSASQIDLADRALVKSFDRLLNRGRGANLGAVLDDAVVLLCRTHQLPSLPKIVGTGLFDVDVLARLAGPNGYQRVPMVGRSNRDSVD